MPACLPARLPACLPACVFALQVDGESVGGLAGPSLGATTSGHREPRQLSVRATQVRHGCQAGSWACELRCAAPGLAVARRPACGVGRGWGSSQLATQNCGLESISGALNCQSNLFKGRLLGTWSMGSCCCCCWWWCCLAQAGSIVASVPVTAATRNRCSGSLFLWRSPRPPACITGDPDISLPLLCA